MHRVTHTPPVSQSTVKFWSNANLENPNWPIQNAQFITCFIVLSKHWKSLVTSTETQRTFWNKSDMHFPKIIHCIYMSNNFTLQVIYVVCIFHICTCNNCISMLYSHTCFNNCFSTCQETSPNQNLCQKCLYLTSVNLEKNHFSFSANF